MQIRFPVGDWSNDGHGRCENFMVETAEGVELDRVREAHFGLLDWGINVGKLCRRYEDNTLWAVRSESQRDQMIDRAQFCIADLVRAGFPVEETIKKFSTDVFPVADEDGTRYENLLPHDVFLLWVDLLNWFDPGLGLREIAPLSIPTIGFYGKDRFGRHLETPGYGCFFN